MKTIRVQSSTGAWHHYEKSCWYMEDTGTLYIYRGNVSTISACIAVYPKGKWDVLEVEE